jgi:hypothetical protein
MYPLKQPTFNYLDGKEGRIIAVFYGQPNRDIINSLLLVVLDPRYTDSKMAYLEFKQILDISNGSEWANPSHPLTLTTAYRTRQQDQCTPPLVKTSFKTCPPPSASVTWSRGTPPPWRSSWR